LSEAQDILSKGTRLDRDKKYTFPAAEAQSTISESDGDGTQRLPFEGCS